MSTGAQRICRPYRYRPVPIRAAFVPCRRDERFCVRCRHQIWRDRATTDYLSDGVIRMTDLIDSSGQRAAIQIPIARRSTPTPTLHPAVSSLEAYPTPAH